MDLRLTFGEDARNYDRRRPGYVPELFEDIIRYSGANPETRAIEVGIGAGQATEPFLKADCNVTAIEISEGFAWFCREKFASYPNFTIINTPFEEYNGEDGSIDLIYSATAFHWIPREIGYRKAFNLLKNGGTLALFWNRPFTCREDDALHREIQGIYRELWPEPYRKPVEYDAQLYETRKDAMLSSGLTSLEFKLCHNTRYFGAEEYVELLNTYSDHRSLEPNKKLKLEAGIMSAIKEHGNRLAVYDTIDLYMARKPFANQTRRRSV